VVLLPRFGPKPLVTAGMLLAAGSLVWLTRIGVHSGRSGPLRVPASAAAVPAGAAVPQASEAPVLHI